MARESYYELLRRPDWQRRRLEVLQAAGFARSLEEAYLSSADRSQD